MNSLIKFLVISLFCSSLSFGQGKSNKSSQWDQYSALLVSELTKMSNYNLIEFTKAAKKIKFVFFKKTVVHQGQTDEKNLYVFIYNPHQKEEKSSMFLSRSMNGDLINMSFLEEDLHNSLEGELNRRKYKRGKPYVSVSEYECKFWETQNQRLNLCMGIPLNDKEIKYIFEVER